MHAEAGEDARSEPRPPRLHVPSLEKACGERVRGPRVSRPADRADDVDIEPPLPNLRLHWSRCSSQVDRRPHTARRACAPPITARGKCAPRRRGGRHAQLLQRPASMRERATTRNRSARRAMNSRWKLQGDVSSAPGFRTRIEGEMKATRATPGRQFVGEELICPLSTFPARAARLDDRARSLALLRRANEHQARRAGHQLGAEDMVTRPIARHNENRDGTLETARGITRRSRCRRIEQDTA